MYGVQALDRLRVQDGLRCGTGSGSDLVSPIEATRNHQVATAPCTASIIE